ncbi:MAG: hypothetical protein IAE80_10385 [Anaerolinea sp.]|nr:hypothetical protein [Anaerolinea sp.]
MTMRAMILNFTRSPFRGTILPAARSGAACLNGGLYAHSASDPRFVALVGGVDARGGWIGLPGSEQTAQFNARGASLS